MQKIILLLFILTFSFFSSFAQEVDGPFIDWKKKGYDNKIKFSMQNLPELKPIPGAVKKPKVNHLWLFGDGEYSFAATPEHVYASIQAEAFEAECFLTYTYTDDEQVPEKKKRRRKKTRVPVSATSRRAKAVASTSSFNRKNKNKSKENTVFMQTNRSPKAGEEFVAILSYRNTSGKIISGDLNLYFNENKTCSDCFELAEQPKLYHDEIYRSSEIGMVDIYTDAVASIDNSLFFTKASIDGLSNANNYSESFANQESFKIDNLENGKEYHIFVILKTAESKTGASITTHAFAQFTGLNGRTIDEYEMELKLVSAHDPNNVLAANYNGRMQRKFDLPWKKTDRLSYKINFQNDGDGAASNIKVVLDIPPVFDTTSLEITEAAIGKNKDILAEKTHFSHKTYRDSIVFFFKNISLAGSKQEGIKKSTSRGYITFNIKPYIRKQKRINTQANIYFDKKEVVTTKKSKIRLLRSNRFTLTVGVHSPRPVPNWAIPTVDFSMDNKFISIGTSALLPKSRVSMDASILYSTEKYESAEIGAEQTYNFQHLTFNIIPQIDVLPFLRIGVGVESGLLLAGYSNETLEFSPIQANTDERYTAIRYGGIAQILIGRTKKRGLALGASYNRFHDDLPILRPNSQGEEQKWHDSIRIFLRYKI